MLFSKLSRLLEHERTQRNELEKQIRKEYKGNLDSKLQEQLQKELCTRIDTLVRVQQKKRDASHAVYVHNTSKLNESIYSQRYPPTYRYNMTGIWPSAG
jgi:hypothetical protein